MIISVEKSEVGQASSKQLHSPDSFEWPFQRHNPQISLAPVRTKTQKQIIKIHVKTIIIKEKQSWKGKLEKNEFIHMPPGEQGGIDDDDDADDVF